MAFLINSTLTREPSFLCPNCNSKTAHKVTAYYLDTSSDNNPHHRMLKAYCRTCEGTAYILESFIHHENDEPIKDENLIWDFFDPDSGGISRSSFTANLDLLIQNEIVAQRVVEPNVAPGIPPVNVDLSDGVKKLYNEAASVLYNSPRAAAALLRLTLETMLTIDFSLKKGTIMHKIGDLYAENIPTEIDTALHFVRIAGNAADHPKPGLINLDGVDGEETVQTLFNVINFIADDQITRKKKLNGLSKFFTSEQQKNINDQHEKIDKQKKQNQ